MPSTAAHRIGASAFVEYWTIFSHLKRLQAFVCSCEDFKLLRILQKRRNIQVCMFVCMYSKIFPKLQALSQCAPLSTVHMWSDCFYFRRLQARCVLCHLVLAGLSAFSSETNLMEDLGPFLWIVIVIGIRLAFFEFKTHTKSLCCDWNRPHVCQIVK